MGFTCCRVLGGLAATEAAAIGLLVWALWASRRGHLRWVAECLSMVRTAKAGETKQ